MRQPPMPRRRKLGASKKPSNLPHVNGLSSAVMSTFLPHLRGAFPAETKALKAYVRCASALRRRHVADCLDRVERHPHVTDAGDRAVGGHAAQCSVCPLGARWALARGAWKARRKRRWPVRESPPRAENGPKPASNFDGSAAVQHFCSGRTRDVCYYPPPPSSRRPRLFGQARFIGRMRTSE